MPTPARNSSRAIRFLSLRRFSNTCEGRIVPPQNTPLSGFLPALLTQTTCLLLSQSSQIRHHLTMATSEKDGKCGESQMPTSLSRPQSPSRDRSKSKRKLALSIGYIGTGYTGLQYNTHANTIEGELEKALQKSGCILGSGIGELDRLGWSRSSRTDKEVHAAQNLVSAKLLLDVSTLNSNGFSPELASQLNQYLPDTIRVFGVSRQSKSFRAKEACRSREYRYIFPTAFIQKLRKERSAGSIEDTGAVDASAFAARMRELAMEFEEVHNFHNFTRGLNKTQNRKRTWAMRDAGAQVALTSTENENELQGTPEVTGVEQTSSAEENFLEEDEDTPQVDDSISKDRQYDRRPLVISGRRVIYRCEVLEPQVIGGEEVLVFVIEGQSFLLNQIRNIVGSLLAVASGHLPSTAVHCALRTNYAIPMPIAPPDGLYLEKSSFFAKGEKIQTLEAQGAAAAAEFRSALLSHIVERWNSTPNLEDFIASLSRISPTRTQETQLTAIWENFTNSSQEVKDSREKLDQNRRQDALDNNAKASQYWRLLPRKLSTAISVRFRLPPGRDVANIQRALAQRILDKKIPQLISLEECLQIIEIEGAHTLMQEAASDAKQ